MRFPGVCKSDGRVWPAPIHEELSSAREMDLRPLVPIQSAATRRHGRTGRTFHVYLIREQWKDLVCLQKLVATAETPVISILAVTSSAPISSHLRAARYRRLLPRLARKLHTINQKLRKATNVRQKLHEEGKIKFHSFAIKIARHL